MKISIYDFDDAGLQHLAVNAFLATVSGLVEYGQITKAQADDITARYTMLTSKRGIFGRAFDRWFTSADKESSIRMQLVQVNHIEAAKAPTP